MLYFAYGSNLNLSQMSRRCPDAKPLAKFALPNYRLVFRGVADCIPEPGARCWGGIWRITPRCERALDAYEGIGSGLYRKEYLAIEGADPGEDEMLVYAMNSTGIFPPSKFYLEGIREGYRDFRLPVRHLNDAVRGSWDDKAPSHVERRRHRRKGRPALAVRPGIKKPPLGDGFLPGI